MLLNNIISSCITNSLNTNVRRYIIGRSTARNTNSTHNGVYTAQYIKMVNEIGGKTRTNNNNNDWCEWKIIAPKSEQICRKLHGWTLNKRIELRPHARSFFPLLPLCSSSLSLASIKDSYYTVLLLSIRDYFSLFFSVLGLLFFHHPPPTMAIVFSRKLFSIRFMAFTNAVSPSNLFSSHCVPTLLSKSKLKRGMPSRVAIETVCKFSRDTLISEHHLSIVAFCFLNECHRHTHTHTPALLFHCGCDLFSATFRNQTFYDPCLLMPSFTLHYVMCVRTLF